jgi:dGTPase
MQDTGGFNHNLHGYKIVTELEKRYPNFCGLNLTYEVREGIVKHRTEFDIPTKIPEFKIHEQPSLEAQVVDIADEIAYDNHDLDDGLTSDIIKNEDLEKVALWENAYSSIKREASKYDNKGVLKYHVIRKLINQQVDDLLKESERKIKAFKLKSPQQAKELNDRIISFSPLMQTERNQARKFLKENLYYSARIIRMTSKAKRFIKKLFNTYNENPKQMPPDIFEKMNKRTKKERFQAICDYIAGMTDRYVLDEHKKLFDPYEKV